MGWHAVQEVTRLLPAPLPMPPQLFLTFSSRYLFQAASDVQKGHFVLTSSPEAPALCQTILGLGIREEFYMASALGSGLGRG